MVLDSSSRNVRLAYESAEKGGSVRTCCPPPRQINAGVKVSVERIPAMSTNKKATKARTQASTLGTGLRTEIRADFYDVNSFSQGLVLDEALQLVKAPAMQPEIKPFALIPSYSPEVFHYNTGSCFAPVNDPLAHVAVGPSLETSLHTRNFLQKLTGASSAFSLKPSPQPLKIQHALFDFLTAEKFLVAGNSNVIYPEVDAKSFPITRNVLDVPGKCDMHEYAIFSLDDLGGLGVPVQILPITLRNINRDVNVT